jgi:hypothetical protein
MSDKVYPVLVCALIGVISVLGVLCFQAFSDRGALHADTAMSAPNMLAVTGSVGSNTAVLYVVDTEKKSLAVYRAIGAKGVRFVGARRIKYDFELISFNDASPKGYRVSELKEGYLKSQSKGDEDRKKRKRR